MLVCQMVFRFNAVDSRCSVMPCFRYLPFIRCQLVSGLMHRSLLTVSHVSLRLLMRACG